MRDPVMGWLDEEDYEVEAVPEDAYFSRAAAQVEFETRQRIVFKAVV